MAPRGRGVIAGIVMNRASGEPVRKAAVILKWQERKQYWASSRTDASGRFIFDNLPAGSYSLGAHKAGQGSAFLGSSDNEELPDLLTLAPGERRDNIVLRLVRPSVISGMVLDGDGEPLTGAQVQLFLEGFPRGVRALVPASSVMTNDRGEYRFRNIAPGQYYVAAAKTIGRRLFLRENDVNEFYLRQFHGGQTEWTRATPLRINSGERVAGIDFRLPLVSGFQAVGQVFGIPDLPAGSENPSVQVSLSSFGMDATGQTYTVGAHAPDYRFRFGDAIPGVYALQASMTVGGKRYWALRKVDLTSDPGDLSLTLAPGITLSGSVRVEGMEADPAGYDVALVRGDGVTWNDSDISAKTGPGGRFTLENVPPGIWDINVGPIPSGGYLKSMSLGKQDVLREDMEITASTNAPLNIVISSRGGVVEGEVEGAAAKRRIYAILLVPFGENHRVMSFYGSAATDKDGKFEIKGVNPGPYRVFAFEKLPRRGLYDPELTAKIEELGVAVEVREAQRAKAKPVVISPAQVEKVLE